MVKRRSYTKRFSGGFYPSVMHGLATTGPYFTMSAVAQGVRLLRNEPERMKGRSVTKKSRRMHTRRVRRRSISRKG